jgi:hypothetical protein
MIFLGAGASKAFGVKTLQEMTEDLVRIMESKGHAESVRVIIQNLKKYGLETDFEAMYTIVQGMTDFRQAMKSAGPMAAYVCGECIPLINEKECQEILKEFKAFLLKVCQPDSGVMEKITCTYSRLFHILSENNFNEREQWRRGNIDAMTIVTTNYDMVLEQYFLFNNKSFADGFVKTIEQPLIRQFDIEEFRRDHLKSSTYWLIKLHGSIWMYKYGNSIFKTLVEPEHSPIPVKIQDQMLIFPVKEKPILDYPYYEFYDLFRKEQWKKMLVIGYSFRDEPVNCAIVDNLRKVEDSIILIIDPNAETLCTNLSFLYNIAQQRLIPINGEFGSESVFDNLTIALKCGNRVDFENELTERDRRAKISFIGK